MGFGLKRIFLSVSVVFSLGAGTLVMAQDTHALQVDKLDRSAKETILLDAKSTTISVNGDVLLKLIDSNCACKGCSQADCEFAIVYEVDGSDIFLDLKNPREGSDTGGRLKCDDCQPIEAKGILTGLNPGQYVAHYRKSFVLEAESK